MLLPPQNYSRLPCYYLFSVNSPTVNSSFAPDTCTVIGVTCNSKLVKFMGSYVIKVIQSAVLCNIP